MTFPATTEFEIRANGDNANGGGFDSASAGNDRTQQDGAAVSYTDIVIDGSDNTKATSSGFPFVTADEGHVVNFTGAQTTGDFTDQSAMIDSVAANVATFDRALGTTGSTGGVAKLGGAKLSNQDTIELALAGFTIHAKNDGTHIPSWNTSIDGSNALKIKLIGYNLVRGDLTFDSPKSDKPLFAAGANTTVTDNGWTWENLNFTTTSGAGLDSDSGTVLINNHVHNFSSSVNRLAVNNSSGAGCFVFQNDLASDNGIAIQMLSAARVWDNYIHDSDIGITGSGDSNFWYGNIFARCSTIGINAGTSSDLNFTFHNTFSQNGVAFSATGSSHYMYFNIFADNVDGISFGAADARNQGDFNDFFNQSSNDKVNFTDGSNSIALDPEFVSIDVTHTDLVSDFQTPSVISSISRPFVQGVDEGLIIPITGGTGFTLQTVKIDTIDGSNNATLFQDTGTGATGGEFNIPADDDYNVGDNMDLDLLFPARGSTKHATIGALPREAGGGDEIIIPNRGLFR